MRDPTLIRRWHGWHFDGLDKEVRAIFVDEVTEDAEHHVLVVQGGDRFSLHPTTGGTIVRITRDRYRAALATGDTFAGEVYARTEHQRALTVDGLGDGQLVVAQQPRTQHRPDGGVMALLTAYEIAEEASRHRAALDGMVGIGTRRTARAQPGSTRITGGYDRRMTNRRVTRSIEVAAPPEVVFGILADPRQHPHIDGSRSVRAVLRGPERLTLGSRFGMRMRIGLPYLISNRVVEYDENRRIAWRHFVRHVWRYELEPVPDGGTRVTETFDYAPAGVVGRLQELVGFPARNARGIEATLPRLKALAEDRASAAR